LTFARRSPPRKQPEDIMTLIRRALALVRHRMELQSVTLEEDFAQEIPSGLFDADQVQQVMLVLLVNALEAMPNGGRLKVCTEWDAVASKVRVRVLDNGVGIPPDILPNIFEPFFTTKEDQHQTGLGLSVARNIVEQHGGSLTARSSRLEGTEFTLTLSVGKPASEGTAAMETVHERS
jgi:signal transduction histidine kinase